MNDGGPARRCAAVPPYTASKKGRMMTERKATPKAKSLPKAGVEADAPASRLGDERVRDLTGWRGRPRLACGR